MQLHALLMVGAALAFPVDLFPTNIGYLGSTATAAAPELLQTDTAAAVTGTPKNQYHYPQPIELLVQAFDQKKDDRLIFELMATLSPQYVSEDGWGVYNYGMPGQCRIKQLHVVQRHGLRYPDLKFKFPAKLKNSTYNATGDLEFLNDWNLKLGTNILTTLGNNQLFNNGVKAFFRYGQLFDFDSMDKIVARTTTQQRMTMTAQYFLHGFFGLNWEDYVNLELIIEKSGFNNSLAAWNLCPNNDFSYGKTYYPGAREFKSKYLIDAVDRFNKQISGYNFTWEDLFELQTICAYETNILGFSKFCSLFSHEEWEGYEYYQSVDWYVQNLFGNPMGRALGIPWIEEFRERLTNSTWSPENQVGQNLTLDLNSTFFPLNQSMYLDFAHDSLIHNIITGLGFEQFKADWNFKGPKKDKQFYDLSRITPFAAQLAFEVIECDEAVPADRSSEAAAGSAKTNYVHAILNDNTLSLSKNLPGVCEGRADGWCEFNNFTLYLGTLQEKAQFDFACFGEYNYTETVTDGVPV